MSADSRVGTEIAGHRVASVIGRGGMSVVYLAEHLRLRRRVALKILGPELAEDEAFRERFVRESRIAAGLDHPNIVTVYDAGEADGVLYISMRYVEGTDLERLLRTDTRLDPARAISIVSQAAAALDAAHAEGLVHRDVKPGNILLTRDRRTSADHAYLSDFGVTKRMHTGAGLTRTGQFVGTVDYVSPEQIRNDEVDGRADVYSLGCVLFRCVTGEVPVPSGHRGGNDLRPPPGSTSRPERTLAGAPDRHRRTAHPCAREGAGRTLRHRPAVRRRRRGGGRARHRRARCRPGDRAAARHHPRPEQRDGGSARRRRATVGGLALVSAGVAIAILFLTTRPDDQGTPPTQDAALPQLTWTQVADTRGVFDGPNDQSIAQVMPVDGGVLAFGFNAEVGNEYAAVWTSPDGRAWRRVPGESFGRSGDHRIENATDFGGRLVAVGSERSGGGTDPAVWHSEDQGATWKRIDSVTSGLHQVGKQAAMQAVVEHDPGLVAVGFQKSQEGFDAAIWTSTDAADWSWVTLPSFVEPGDQRMLAATTLARPAGGGRNRIGDGRPRRRRVGGVRWTLVADPERRARGSGRPADAGRGRRRTGIDRGRIRHLERAIGGSGLDLDRRTELETGAAADVGAAGEGNQSMSAVTRLGAGSWPAAGPTRRETLPTAPSGCPPTACTGRTRPRRRRQHSPAPADSRSTRSRRSDRSSWRGVEPGRSTINKRRSGSRRSCSRPRRRPACRTG